jgi:putative sterol carrier protein
VQSKPSNPKYIFFWLLQYLSEKWAEEALRRVETDERIKSAAKDIDVSMLTIFTEAPKGAFGYLYVHFKDGGLLEYRTGHEAEDVLGDRDPTFVVSGTYGNFVAVQQGEISEKRALLAGKLHLTGSMFKAMRHMRALETITGVMREIPCET